MGNEVLRAGCVLCERSRPSLERHRGSDLPEGMACRWLLPAGGVGVHVLPTLDLGYFAEARGNVCPQATDQPSGLVISLG